MSRKQRMILAGLTLAVALVLGCLAFLLSPLLAPRHLDILVTLPPNPFTRSMTARPIATACAPVIVITAVVLAVTYWRQRTKSRQPHKGPATRPGPSQQAAPAPAHVHDRPSEPSVAPSRKRAEHGDRKTDSQLRTLEEFIGQPKIREILTVSIGAARARGDALGHVLLRGPTGCGKRTLARVIAKEMGAKTTSTSGREIAAPRDLGLILTNLGDRSILCIADIQGLPKAIEQPLCLAMRDFALDLVIGKGPTAKAIHLPVPPFTVVGTTTEEEPVSHRLRQSFDHVLDFEPYEVWALVKLVQRLSEDVGVRIDENARLMIARACGGSLAEARRLLMRTRDYAQARADGVITAAVAHKALAMMAPEHSSAVLQPAPETSQMTETGPPLTWQGFEDLIAELFSALGYQNVKVTQRTGDEGKDIIMERADPLRGITRVYVECKHWSSGRVGIKEVQVLHSAVMRDPQVHEGMLVTTGSFTNQARAYARQIGFIELIDRTKLRQLAVKAGLDLDSRIGK